MIPTSTDVTFSVESSASAATSAAVIFIAQGDRKIPASARALGEAFAAGAQRLLDAEVATGKANQITFELLPGRGAKRVILAGLGKPEKVSAESVRQASGAVLRALKKHKLATAAIALPWQLSAEAAAEAVATGILLADFDYREYKGTASKADGEKDSSPKSRKISIIADSKSLAKVKLAVAKARHICDGQNFARTIASRPGNDINPPTLAAAAKKMAAQVGLRCSVMDEKWLRKMGMGGILAVGDGAIETPPRLIVLEHRPARGTKKSPGPFLAVGKAITFDTGGISIKPADKMGKMIFDKCGAMAVLGLMYAVAALKLPIHVVGILSSAENAISSRAYRPGDIIRMYNGVTVEVTNTDAEGRLVLGDALAWGVETFKPSAVVDLATLTGGVIVALGKTMAGVMSTNDELVRRLTAAAEDAGEKIWRLPLGEDQRDYIKSDCADIVNSGGREGHPLQGGAFLSYFLPSDNSVPWAHLDIAGVADTEKELPYYAKGATGWGVRTLFNWVTNQSSKGATE